jgi:preprotein translocase subunit SecA
MAATGVAATAMDTSPKTQAGIGSSAATETPGIAGIGPIRAPVSAALSEQFENVGRNEPCPCGSGKKYKKCHGAAG